MDPGSGPTGGRTRWPRDGSAATARRKSPKPQLRSQCRALSLHNTSFPAGSSRRRKPASNLRQPRHVERSLYEVSSIARPDRRQAGHRRGEEFRRDHHPDTAKEKPMEGEVIAVGAGARNEQGQIVALDVKEGDRVLFGKWSGTEVKLDGEELLIMKESDIMGIIAA